jgi:cytosine/uracil/thiamine/allantoin permease
VSELKELHDFFVASVGAAAALMGLLFVAVSIAPEKIFGAPASAAQRGDAERAFTAFGNVFFVSLVALIPRGALPAIAVVAVIAMAQIVSTAVRMKRRFPSEINWRNIGLISLAIYAFEFVAALQVQAGTRRPETIVYIAIGLYAYALGTSWSLLGARERETTP